MDARTTDRFWRGFAVGGITFLAVGILWFGSAQIRPAFAQVPDSGAQRMQMIREQQFTNQKLDVVIKLLTDIRDQSAEKQDEKRDSGKAKSKQP